jgi:hypothetical protein
MKRNCAEAILPDTRPGLKAKCANPWRNSAKANLREIHPQAKARGN